MTIKTLFGEYKDLYNNSKKMIWDSAPKIYLLLLLAALVLVGIAIIRLQKEQSIIEYIVVMGIAILALLCIPFFESRSRRKRDRRNRRLAEEKLYLRGVVTLLHNAQIDYKDDDEIDAVIDLLDREKNRLDPFSAFRDRGKYITTGIVVPTVAAIFACVKSLSGEPAETIGIIILTMIFVVFCYAVWYILICPIIEWIFFGDKRIYECFQDDLLQLKVFHQANKSVELRADLIPDNKQEMADRRKEIEQEVERIKALIEEV